MQKLSFEIGLLRNSNMRLALISIITILVIWSVFITGLFWAFKLILIISIGLYSYYTYLQLTNPHWLELRFSYDYPDKIWQLIDKHGELHNAELLLPIWSAQFLTILRLQVNNQKVNLLIFADMVHPREYSRLNFSLRQL